MWQTLKQWSDDGCLRTCPSRMQHYRADSSLLYVDVLSHILQWMMMTAAPLQGEEKRAVNFAECCTDQGGGAHLWQPGGLRWRLAAHHQHCHAAWGSFAKQLAVLNCQTNKAQVSALVTQ